MPSDYKAITKYNEEQLGKDTASRKSQVNMYSDFSHFVFEILQNADDYEATTITFSLTQKELIIEHNGIPFKKENVNAISYFGKSTSRDDLIKTGHFGLGFKSVFAFTATPAIYSGDENFKIYSLYRLKALPRPADLDPRKTRICLPFNHIEKQPDFVETLVPEETAFDKISRRLRKLGLTTLLFTHNILEINWMADEKGHYLRGDKDKEDIGEHLQIRKTEITDGDLLHIYLIFSQRIKWKGKEYKPVDIAFFLDDSNDFGQIKPTKEPLFVLFPTTKEINMGFLINGPFRTPPHRETVSHDDEFNQFLIKEIAGLICNALPKIREMGLLSVSFLEALPIRIDDFPEDGLFYPIVEAIRNVLLDQELLPADDGTFVSARNAKLARGAELRKLLTQDQLRELFQSDDDIKWLSGEITQVRTPDLRSYLMSELDVEEITPDGFARRISSTFLASKTDDWFIAFYKYLSGQEALWRSPRWARDSGGLLRRKPILRLQDNEQEVPFRSDGMANAYLPPPEETDFPVVKREIVDNEQASEFLRRLGLSEPDVFDDIVERVLPKYSRQDVSSITPREHAMDIQKILRAMASDSEAGKKKVLRAAKNAPFLRTVDRRGKVTFQKPGDIYVKDEDLQLYFSKATDVWFLDETSVDLPPDAEAWANLGVALRPRRVPFSGGLPSNEIEYSTRQESIENYDLDGLDEFLEHLDETLDIERRRKFSLVLWNYLREHLDFNPRFFKGRYEWFYYSSHTKYLDSRMLVRLRESAWITTRDGNLEKPSDITVSQLGEEFIGAGELIEILDIQQDSDQDISKKELKRYQHAIELGVALEDIELLRRHPEEFEQWKAAVLANKEKPAFPTRISTNPVRRQERLAEQMNYAPDKEYEQRNRSVRKTSNTIDKETYLRNAYTNDDGQMVCQICKEEMPFRKRDGEYYFEAVEALSRDYFAKEHEAQFLALCPLCAAIYNEFVKHNEGAMESLKNALINLEDAEVPLQLGELVTSVRFVNTHFKDIRTIITY